MTEESINSIISKTSPEFSDVLDNLLINDANILYKLDFPEIKYSYMCESVKNLLGFTKDELNEIGFSSIVKKIEKNTQNKHQIFYGGEIDTIEEQNLKYLIETKFGELKWIEDIYFLCKDKDGEIKFSIGILKDITEINNLISRLYNERDYLDSVLEVIEVIYIFSDENGKIKYINNKGCKIVGCERKEIIGKDILSFISRDGKEKALNNNSKSEYFELPLKTKSDKVKVISWHIKNGFDDEGNLIFSLCAGQDITSRKRQEKVNYIISDILDAANTEGNLKELYNFIHSSVRKLMPADNFYIALYDKETNYITFSYFVDEIDSDDVPAKQGGKGLTEYVLRTGKSALINRERDQVLIEQGEVELVGSPSAIWLGIPLTIQDNTIGVLVVQDYKNEGTYTENEMEILEVISYSISRAIERKRVEEERNDLIKKLKEINTSKDKLFSVVSHDLRSPFNSLLGFSEILTTEYSTLTDEEIKEYLNVINEASKSLYSMTTNLLQFSRFQMGTIEFYPIKLSLKKVIEKNLKILRGNILKKQLSLTTEIVETNIYADEDMLGSILQNLISNSIKFTKKGGEIKITTKIIPFFNESHQVEVTIQDNGVGINKEELKKIFKEHMHSTPGTEREYGTGLGLLLVKEFIEKNNGNIKVKSKLNEGTSFTFTLPIMN